MAYLSQVMSKGRRYIYLTEYIGGKHSKTDIHVYGFGERSKALAEMQEWRRDFKRFPRELAAMGFGLRDLREWIETLETGVSKTGRSRNFG
ncbi:MAG TPA: hypothetical protein GX525_12005 [Bacilli bacterium]|nr:hypothetical protein [Bacilli bacterium]